MRPGSALVSPSATMASPSPQFNPCKKQRASTLPIPKPGSISALRSKKQATAQEPLLPSPRRTTQPQRTPYVSKPPKDWRASGDSQPRNIALAILTQNDDGPAAVATHDDRLRETILNAAAVSIACLVFLAIALYQLTLPGLYADEAFDVI